MTMDVRPIRNEKDYEWALKEIEVYFEKEPKKGSPEAARFDVLATLIGAYEDREWPIETPDPIEALHDYMIMHGLKQAQFAALIGSRSRASEVLSKKRPLTIEMVRRVSKNWHIPADVLVQPYHLADGKRR